MADYSKIEKLPEVPQAIIDAVNNKELVVFIGAGVSRIIGCMGWAQLAKNLIELCYRTKKKGKTETLINYKERETLLQENDHKKIITITHGILSKNDSEDKFYEEFDKSLKSKEELKNDFDIYREIFGLRGINITTNADKHYDLQFIAPNRIFNVDDFSSELDITKLYQIHGSQDNRESLVFTVPQYIQRYNKPKFKNFLETVFSKYTVLFLGYGMSEFEILDFLITKYGKPKGAKELKHYILLPFYSAEENILQFEQEYYGDMGIQVIGYEKDENGYNQLYYVIKKWNEDINRTSTYTLDSFNELENLVKRLMKQEDINKILQLIKNDSAQEEHLFKILSSNDKPFPLFKPLKNAGYFNPDKNPAPKEVENQKGYFTIPHWDVLNYLENVAKHNNKNPFEEITNTLLEIVNSIINYRDENNKRIENYRTDWMITKIIFLLPLEKIDNKHFEFIRIALNSKWDNTLIASEIGDTIIPILLESQAKGLIIKLFEIILDYKEVQNNSFDKYTSLLGDYWLTELLKKHKEDLSRLCGLDIASIALAKIQEIIEKDKSQFNNIWIPTIEDHFQTTSPENYVNQLVYLVRDIYQDTNPEKTKNKIEELLKYEHPIFKRLALHIISYHYEELNSLFWEWTDNPLDIPLIKHELYELLKNNYSFFTDEQIKTVIKWIENKKYYISDEDKNDENVVKKILAFSKKEWLFALLETKNKEIISLYQKYDSINPTKLEHPGFDIWTETTWGDISPISEAELVLKSLEEIVDYLNNFKETRKWKDPTTEGLSRTLRKIVSENPEKYIKNLNLFLKVKLIYQHAILGGLLDARRTNKSFSWKNLFNFINTLLSSKTFWEENNSTKYNYRNWIISEIADLINEGTKSVQRTFDPEYLPVAEKILLLLIEKNEHNSHEMHDIVTSVLNSNKGKIFTAIINYSLMYARIYLKDKKNRWKETIKKDFTRRLDKSNDSSLDFRVVLGEYLPILYYLDENWVDEKINQIFLKEDDELWKSAFTGYLFYSSNVYSNIYKLLAERGHYDKAIITKFDDDHIYTRLAQHICVAYIEDWENFDENSSLISKLIEINNPKHILAIINFFWHQRDHLIPKVKKKIKPLWKKLYLILKIDKEQEKSQKLLSELSKWLVLVDVIDKDIFEWLKLSVKYFQKSYSISFFVEYLLIHVNKTPKYVAELYISMLDINIYPRYEEKNILEIIKTLHEKDLTKEAIKICNLYLHKGFDFVKPIYEDIKKES